MVIPHVLRSPTLVRAPEGEPIWRLVVLSPAAGGSLFWPARWRKGPQSSTTPRVDITFSVAEHCSTSSFCQNEALPRISVRPMRPRADRSKVIVQRFARPKGLLVHADGTV